MYMPGAQRGQKMALDPLELELRWPAMLATLWMLEFNLDRLGERPTLLTPFQALLSPFYSV